MTQKDIEVEMLEPLFKSFFLHRKNAWLQQNPHISFDCLSMRLNGQTA